MEDERLNLTSQAAEITQEQQLQQPKTVTFCCTMKKPEGVDTATKESAKQERNRLRSAQRAYEQQTYLRLRGLVPTLRSMHKKASRLETLKHTCEYIYYLKETMEKLKAIKREREATENVTEVKSDTEMLGDEE